MHKKYNKYSKKDALHKTSSQKRTHVKHKKDNNDSLNEIIKVPQNSKCDMKNYYGDIENTENFKPKQRHSEKLKCKKSEQNKSTERHNRKHEKQSNHHIHKADSLLLQNERLAKHKENYSKKEKRDKERLNNIEKYLEGLNPQIHKVKGRNRSTISLRSTEIFESKKRHVRREKTFHGEISRRRDHSESYPILSETKRLKDQTRKEKEAKKYKHKENKAKDSNKEREKREISPKQLLYCQIDNPLLEAFNRNREAETHSSLIHKDRKQKSSSKVRGHSSSKGRSTSPRDEMKMRKLEKSSENRDRPEHSKEKGPVEQNKHSQRKANRKDIHKSTKEPESMVNLGPYDKYFVIDKEETENENKHHKKWRRVKNKESLKKLKSGNGNENMPKEERKQKKKYPEKRPGKAKENILASTQDQFREKIEDDIKSYFMKIQTLIDKKLEYILHGNSGENSKINDGGKENFADATQNKKRRRSGSKEEKKVRLRNKSMRKHKSREDDNAGNIDKEQTKRNHKSHASIGKEERKSHYEDMKRQRHHKSPTKFEIGNLGTINHLDNGEKESRHYKLHNSPPLGFRETTMPTHLINMAKEPSTYSMKSKKSYSGEKMVVKEMNSEAKIRKKHIHKVTNNGNNQKDTHRESSLARRNISPEEVTYAGTANDFCLENIETPMESHGKKSKKRPLNLECKTISIIGIPSQTKESIIFNETQTTTTVNVNKAVDDPVERKKKTKRFKLYYKYSLANNSCPKSESDNSSDGKSIVSDSYRIVSGNSEHSSDVCVNRVVWDPPKESGKIVFVMKRESVANISGDTSDNQIAIEQFSKRCRKQRTVTPDASKLNNIVEEPSNMSCLGELNKTLQYIKSDLHCKYFNMLNSSSSACNLHLLKKSTVSDWNMPIGKCKCRIFDNSEKNTTTKIDEKKAHVKDDSLENKLVKNIDHKRNEKIKKIKDKILRDFGQKYTSKSDIDISYDSLHTYKNDKILKLNKGKRNVKLSSHLIESSTYTPSEIYTIRNHRDYPDKHHLKSDLVHEDRTELKLKESVCQTESEIYKEAIEELIITKACRKYFANILESHHVHKQDVAKNKDEDINSEEVPRSGKKGAGLEVTRIPSILNKRRAERLSPLPEINIPAKGIAQDTSQKPTKRSHIPERINLSSKSNQKKQVDVEVEVAALDEKLRKQSQNSPKRKKTADDTGYAKVNTPKRNFNNSIGRNTENIEKTVEANKLYSPKQNSYISRDLSSKRSASQQSKTSNSQQSKRPSNRPTEVIRPVRLPIYPKVSARVVSGRTKIPRIARPFSAREKLRNEKDMPRKTAHEIKRSVSAIDKLKKPFMSDIKKKPRLAVKCSKARDISAQKFIAINTSRSTVPGSNKTQKQTRSNSCSYRSRVSNKCVDLITPKSNRSFVDANTESEGSKITSLVCLNKFIYDTNLNLDSNSQARSLDQYTTKSINDRHSSRLFLTKDYIPQLNTYQRRKLYSEGLRKKMKRHWQHQNVIAPQVFEVRYLTFEKDALNEGSEATSRDNSTFESSKFGSMNKVSSTAREQCRKNTSPRITPVKKSRKYAQRFSGRNPFFDTINDVDMLNKYRKRQFPEVKIEDIFIKGNKSEEKDPNSLDICEQLTKIQSSSIVIKDDTNSFSQFKSLSHNSTLKLHQNFNSQAHFMRFLDCLCKSIVGHCNSDSNLPQGDCQGPPRKSKSTNNMKQIADVNMLNDIDAQNQAKLSTTNDPCINPKTSEDRKSNGEVPSLAAEPTNFVSSKNTKHKEKPSTDQHEISLGPLASGHASCPALAGTAPSFEFLYEDDSSELSKQTILEGLTKPWDTILGYALHCNDTVIIRKEACTSMGNKIDQMSNSPTDSGESGYSSNCSKKCSSATSFFKKPYVAALFKSPSILKVQPQNKDSNNTLIDSNQCLRTARYNIMSKNCQEYAQKVRMQSESKEESEDAFQEIPLNILLRRKSSTILGQCNSDCSICKEYADEMKNVASSSRVFSEEESLDTLEQNESLLETFIYYGNSRCKPSLEMVKSQQSKTDLANVDNCNTLEQELNDCPMIVSNTNLHKCSLTLIDVRQNKDYIREEDSAKTEAPLSKNSKTNYNEQEAAGNVSASNPRPVEDPTGSTANDEIIKGNDDAITDDELEDTFNSSSGVTSDLVSTFSISAPETNKLMAKKFFENLLRVYEKEMAVTTQLFQDDDFFVNDLLSCVNEADEKRKRKGKFKRIIKGKIRGYIESVFATKNSPVSQSLCTYNTEQSIVKFENISQKKLKMLAYNARKYFSLFVQAVTANKNINDEIKICGLLKILQRIENGDFTILRTNQEVNFENEIKHQVKEAFINIYEISVKEAKKYKRSLTIDDLKLIKAFVSKYRIGLLSKTDIIATYIGRGIFKTETHLSAAVTYLIRIQSKDVDLKEFEEYCKVCTCTESKK